MHCTIVVDDFNGRRDLLAEHGLSIYLKTPRGNVLFDAGQGICLLHNAHAMGLDLGLVDHSLEPPDMTTLGIPRSSRRRAGSPLGLQP